MKMDKDAKRLWSFCMMFIGIFIIGFGVGALDLFYFISGTVLAFIGLFVLPDEDKLSDKRFKVVPYWDDESEEKYGNKRKKAS